MPSCAMPTYMVLSWTVPICPIASFSPNPNIIQRGGVYSMPLAHIKMGYFEVSDRVVGLPGDRLLRYP